MNKIKCPHCGAENDFDAVHCKKCGALVDTPKTNKREVTSVMDSTYTSVLRKYKISYIVIGALSIGAILALIFGRNFFFGYWENLSSDFVGIFANTFALWLAAILMVCATHFLLLPEDYFYNGEIIMEVLLVLMAIGGAVGLWYVLGLHLSGEGVFQVLFSLILGASLSFNAFFLPIKCYSESVTTKTAIKSLIISLLTILVVIFLCLTGCWLFNHQNAGLAFLMIILGLGVMGGLSTLQFVIIF